MKKKETLKSTEIRTVKALSSTELELLIGGRKAKSLDDDAGSTTTDVSSELASGGTTVDTDV